MTNKALTLNLNLSNLKGVDFSDPRLGLPSASAAPRLGPCPASWRMEQNQPKLQRYAEAADAGDRVHAALAGTMPASELLMSEKHTYDDAVKGRDAIVREWCGKGEEPHKRIKPEEWESPEAWHKEKRHYLRVNLKPITSGQWDESYLQAHVRNELRVRLLIIDHKTGWADYGYAQHSLQLRVYALIAWVELLADGYDVESVSVAFNKPPFGEEGWHYEYTPTELHSAWMWWEKVLQAVFSDEPPIIPGSHCQFCKAQVTCPARSRQRAELTLKADTLMESWDTLAPSDKLRMWKAWKAVESLGGLMQAQLKAELREGEIAGLALKPGRAQREVVNVSNAYRKLCDAVGADKVLPMLKLSYAKGRDALVAKMGWKKKDADKEALAWFGTDVEDSTTDSSIIITDPN